MEAEDNKESFEERMQLMFTNHANFIKLLPFFPTLVIISKFALLSKEHYNFLKNDLDGEKVLKSNLNEEFKPFMCTNIDSSHAKKINMFEHLKNIYGGNYLIKKDEKGFVNAQYEFAVGMATATPYENSFGLQYMIKQFRSFKDCNQLLCQFASNVLEKSVIYGQVTDLREYNGIKTRWIERGSQMLKLNAFSLCNWGPAKATLVMTVNYSKIKFINDVSDCPFFEIWKDGKFLRYSNKIVTVWTIFSWLFSKFSSQNKAVKEELSFVADQTIIDQVMAPCIEAVLRNWYKSQYERHVYLGASEEMGLNDLLHDTIFRFIALQMQRDWLISDIEKNFIPKHEKTAPQCADYLVKMCNKLKSVNYRCIDRAFGNVLTEMGNRQISKTNIDDYIHMVLGYTKMMGHKWQSVSAEIDNHQAEKYLKRIFALMH